MFKKHYIYFNRIEKDSFPRSERLSFKELNREKRNSEEKIKTEIISDQSLLSKIKEICNVSDIELISFEFQNTYTSKICVKCDKQELRSFKETLVFELGNYIEDIYEKNT